MSSSSSQNGGRSWHLLGPLVGLIGLVCGALFFFAWQVAHRGDFQYNVAIYPLDDADEWRYTACSRLVEHGYSMFTQVFSAQPPLLFASLAWSMRVFGDSIAGARWVEFGFGILTVISAGVLAWMLFGPVAAGSVAVLLSVSPLFLVYGRAIEAEGPMMALTTLSLTLAVACRQREQVVLAVFAGMALAAAALFKLFAVEAVLPALWILWLAEDVRSRVRAVGGFVAAMAFPLAANFLLVSPSEQWSQVISMHERAASIPLPGLLSPERILSDFAGADPGLVLLAIAGVTVLAVFGVWEDAAFLVLWVGGAALMLLLFRPLFPHHAAILLPSLAVAAGAAVTVAVEQLRSRRWLASAPLVAVVLAYMILSPRLAHADRHVLVPGLPPATERVAAAIASHSGPGSFVAADNLAAAALASRLVPPPLCDLSNVRFRSGYSDTSLLIRATRRYRAQLVVASPGGIFSQARGYLPWVRAHYRSVWSIGGTEIFSTTR